MNDSVAKIVNSSLIVHFRTFATECDWMLDHGVNWVART